MSRDLHFYFDYSSPYGYLASERIEGIAGKHDRQVVWHPILLGAVFKVTGQAPLTEAPLKGDYSVMDFHRSAREIGIDYVQPEPFPIASIAVSRASLWIRDNSDNAIASKLADFIHSVFRAFYVQGRDITDSAIIQDIANSLEIDPQTLSEGIGNQSIKDALRSEVSEAIDKGVFGSPMFIVDEELFWGHDRLEQLDRWLASGGW